MTDPRKDRVLSEELKKRMSEVRKGRPALNKKPVCIEGRVYGSAQEAADAIGVCAACVRKRIANPDWEYEYV